MKSAIVLDLDETLVHAQEGSMDLWNQYRKDPELVNRIKVIDMHDVVTPKGTGEVEQMWMITRPYLKEFLKTIRDIFDYVFVWSAGKYEYVHDLVTKIFPYEPDHIYTDKDIYKKDGVGHKPLDKILKDYPDIDSARIIALDDKDYTFKYNPKMGMLVPAYEPDTTEEDILEDDTTLLSILDLFEEANFPKEYIRNLRINYFIEPDE